MASFEFTVNLAFLNYASHPITIPKSQLPYQTLGSIGLDHKHVTVILPQGERFEAKVYHGKAGHGEYYQFRFKGGHRILPGYLKLNVCLIVFLIKMASHSYAILEYRA